MKSKVTSIDQVRKAKQQKMLDDVTDRMLNMREWETQMLKEHGWYQHAVPAGQYDDSPDLANYHTHGLTETMNHPDLQIVFNIDHLAAHGIFGHYIRQIKDGLRIKDGDKLPLNDRHCAWFRTFRETGREVLRIIIPDENGRFPGIFHFRPE